MAEQKLSGPDRSSIERFILSFCADYKVWNDATHAEYSSRPDVLEDRDRIEDSYHAFLEPFITPDAYVQLPTFGSEATFDPDLVSFGAVLATPSETEVTFSVRSTIGDWSSEFVAQLVCQPVLMLRQILYIASEPDEELERLPML